MAAYQPDVAGEAADVVEQLEEAGLTVVIRNNLVGTVLTGPKGGECSDVRRRPRHTH
jgi:hypothetical protein